MKNNNIVLPSIIHFDLIKLMYELNPDIYEKVDLQKIDENNAMITILTKHFFEDLGLPQRYAYLRIQKKISNEAIIFEGETIDTAKPAGIPDNSQILAVKKIITCCEIVTNHHIKFTHNIYFDEAINIPPFVEKMIGTIVNKIFKRIKQFIENITIK
jgi:hypothetical protein